MRIAIGSIVLGLVLVAFGVDPSSSKEPSLKLHPALSAASSSADSCLITLNGDVNNSGTVTSGDLIVLVNYCFKGGALPLPCLAAGDINCSSTITSADIIALRGYVFKGGQAPCDICNGSALAAGCI